MNARLLLGQATVKGDAEKILIIFAFRIIRGKRPLLYEENSIKTGGSGLVHECGIEYDGVAKKMFFLGVTGSNHA